MDFAVHHKSDSINTTFSENLIRYQKEKKIETDHEERNRFNRIGEMLIERTAKNLFSVDSFWQYLTIKSPMKGTN